MITRLGAIFGDASGSVGGVTILRSSGGHTARVRKSRQVVKSSATSGVKSMFLLFCQSWSSLDQSEIDSWNIAANTLPSPNRIGQNVKRSGFALFMNRNLSMSPFLAVGYSSYPGSGSFPPLQPIQLTISSLIASFTFFCSDSLPSTIYVRIFGTPPLSPGISAPAKYYRFFTYLPFDTVQPFQMADIYKAYFRTVGSANAVIWVKYDLVDSLTGATSPQMQASISIPV